jgi:hypothetical protein
MPDMVDAGDAGAEHLLVGDEAADRHAAEVDAVIAALAADQAKALSFAARAVIGERDLERRVDRLGARVGEEDAREPLRRDAREPIGELESDRMAHLEGGREVHLLDLPLDCLDDLRPAVAGVHAPQARGAVEHLASLGCPVVHALRALEQPRRLLELPVRGERHPEGRPLEVGSEFSAFVHAPTLHRPRIAAAQ